MMMLSYVLINALSATSEYIQTTLSPHALANVNLDTSALLAATGSCP